MASNEARKHSHEATQSKGHLQALELHKNLSENRAEQESNTTERDQTHRKREAEREIAELAKTKDELIRPASEVKQVDLHKSKILPRKKWTSGILSGILAGEYLYVQGVCKDRLQWLMAVRLTRLPWIPWKQEK